MVFTRSLRDRAALFWVSATGRSMRIREALRQTRPDLVHAHFAKDAWMILRACRALQIPLVVTVHGYDVTALPRVRGVRGCINRCRTRKVLRSADAVVAVSEFIRDEALRWGAPQGRVRVLPIGVPVTEPAIAVSRPVDVVFLGRLVPKKGVRDALQAIAAQPDAHALTCEVIGDGPLRADAEALAKQLDLRVTFTGSLPPTRVAQHLARARILLAPSQYAADGDAEGFGMVFLEAALAGVPAVAYRHGVCRRRSSMERQGSWCGKATQPSLLPRYVNSSLMKTCGPRWARLQGSECENSSMSLCGHPLSNGYSMR